MPMSKQSPLEMPMSRKHHMADELFRDAIRGVQLICDVDSLDFVAIIGKVLGNTLACADCKMESDHNIKEGELECEPLKQTMLINFQSSYNNHRSVHALSECVKPEPKIV